MYFSQNQQYQITDVNQPSDQSTNDGLAKILQLPRTRALLLSSLTSATEGVDNGLSHPEQYL